MKRKLIVLTFMLSFLVSISNEKQAQTDAYFSNTIEYRLPDATGLSFDKMSVQFGHGLNFGAFDGQEGGINFESFTGRNAPLTNGLIIMTATGLIYLMSKRRKENEK